MYTCIVMYVCTCKLLFFHIATYIAIISLNVHIIICVLNNISPLIQLKSSV